MNNFLSNCWLVDGRISASEKDLPVFRCDLTTSIHWIQEYTLDTGLAYLIYWHGFFISMYLSLGIDFTPMVVTGRGPQRNNCQGNCFFLPYSCSNKN